MTASTTDLIKAIRNINPSKKFEAYRNLSLDLQLQIQRQWTCSHQILTSFNPICEILDDRAEVNDTSDRYIIHALERNAGR